MKTFSTIFALIVLVTAFSPDRHLRMTKSEPVKKGTLSEVPLEIRLWFNQDIHLNVSTITLYQLEIQDGMVHEVPVELSEVQASEDPRSFFAPLPDSLGLKDGDWKVTWSTAGNDEHVVEGAFTFALDTE